MKKTYFAPEMEVVEIEKNIQLLAGSAPGLGGEYCGDPILAPEADDDLLGLDPLNMFGF